ncbi:MAG TPA: hypothetical protein EYG98_03920 [Sulfurovum sp.]|nr:hypothetical protein [Sulfurovum sp.]
MKALKQQPIHKNLMTSALPQESDFSLMADDGYEIVISMCQSEDSLTLDNEDAMVTNAGMKYLHLPVDYYEPTMMDYTLLRDILNTIADKKVWLHCTKNYRVSAFMYLYNILERGADRQMAKMSMNSIWKPTDAWENMIEETLEKYAYQYL